MASINPHVEKITTEMLAAFQSGEIANKIAETLIARADGDPAAPSAAWSFNNQLLMMWVGDTLDARGMKQWSAVGRRVKKGSKATYILAPLMKRWKEKDAQGETVERGFCYGFKAIPVFRVEDTEGDPLVSGNPEDYEPATLPPLAHVADAFGVSVTYGPHFGQDFRGTYGWGDGRRRIELLTHDQRTWFHELAHAAHHRLLGDDFTSASRDRLEVVAELSACALARIYTGLDTTGTSHAYIEAFTSDSLAAMLRAIKEVAAVVTLITDTDVASGGLGAVTAA
jgi:hypothetical protein